MVITLLTWWNWRGWGGGKQVGGEVGVRRGGGGAQEREQSRLVEKEFPSKLANSSFSVRDFPLSRITPYSLGASQTLWTHHEKGGFCFRF